MTTKLVLKFIFIYKGDYRSHKDYKISIWLKNSGEAVVTLTDRPESVRNCCVNEVFGGAFVSSRCFLDVSVGVEAFVT